MLWSSFVVVFWLWPAEGDWLVLQFERLGGLLLGGGEKGACVRQAQAPWMDV